MSAFAVLYNRSGGPLEPGLFECVMERLSHRGPDGQDTLVSGPLAMGHWRFWTTPEEVGERQPLKLDGLPFTLVFDGRLDNREELFAALSISAEEGRSLSDAALVLRAYATWSQNCVEHFIGEFALVLFDERQHSLFCSRDHLGDRTLFYAQHGNRVVIASEPWAVLGASELAPILDDRAVAHYFALRVPEDGQTLFKNVFELLPAHYLKVSESAVQVNKYWHANFDKKIRYKTDEDYSQHFLSLFEESVRCRMRATTPVGVQMSGGLDSTAIACLAARQIAPQRLTTISMVFKEGELATCDESQFINAVQRKWNLFSLQIPADSLWTYQDLENWPHNPSHPVDFPHRFFFLDTTHAEAQARGLRVLLTGEFGDNLFGSAGVWLLDYLSDFKLTEAFREVFWHLSQKDIPKSFIVKFAKPFVLELIRSVPYDKIDIFRTQKKPLPWLTSFALDQLAPIKSVSSSLRRQSNGLLGLRGARISSDELFYASRHNLEIRAPYRDRRLVEYFIALPAYQFYRRGMNKYVVRNALKDILPELVRNKKKNVTSLSALYFRGIEREEKILSAFHQSMPDFMRTFVKFDWIEANWLKILNCKEINSQLMSVWLCVSFQLWYYRLFSESEL